MLYRIWGKPQKYQLTTPVLVCSVKTTCTFRHILDVLSEMFDTSTVVEISLDRLPEIRIRSTVSLPR